MHEALSSALQPTWQSVLHATTGVEVGAPQSSTKEQVFSRCFDHNIVGHRQLAGWTSDILHCQIVCFQSLHATHVHSSLPYSSALLQL